MYHVKSVYFKVVVLSMWFMIFTFIITKISLNTPSHWPKCIIIIILQIRQLKYKDTKSLS